MHPDDVAERVAEEVELLRARLAAAPELRAGEPRLEDRFELIVPFRARQYTGAIPILVPTSVPCPWCGPLMRPVLVRYGAVERELQLVSDCSDYDAQPITADLRHSDGQSLTRWPRDPAIILGHPLFARPFFCRRGLREFHTHPQHEDKPWDRYRESIRIQDIIPELLGELQRRWVVL